ncbi:hypothetical protein EN816_00730 [Mesorhizobium sp. M8A.F.Ca.ET.173.01.1.1]|nr:hypothetical protein EN816_00730 [Mesorhizobium sp. M8A.F.Ca.ET.173.01.1.1]
MGLIAYAGQDQDEPPLETQEWVYLQRQSHTRPEMAYRLFLKGANTFDIAKHFKRGEPTVLRWITAERCRRHGLDNPYRGAKP